MRTGLNFEVGGLRLSFSAPGEPGEGELVSCSAGTAALLTRGVLATARASGRDVAWESAGLVADIDELEVTRHSDVGVRATLRHTFDAGWRVRLLLFNPGRTAVVLDDVTLTWRPASATLTCAYAAGAEAGYSVQPMQGDGPVLSGRLESGVQLRVDDDGLGLGSMRLEPGGRHVVRWRWEAVARPRDVPRSGARPVNTWLENGQGATLATTPDVAVLAPGLEQLSVAGGLELAANTPGRYPVELRSARGTTMFALRWAPDLSELVVDAATAAMGGTRVRSGAVRLADAAVGIVLQQALDQQHLPNIDDAQDALDLLAGELSEGPRSDPLSLAFLTREADRSGDVTLLDRAYAALLATPAPVQGLGLVAARVAVSAIRTGRPVRALTEHLERLEPRLEAADAGTGSGIELALLVRRRDAGPADASLVAALRRLGAVLGSGLPGDVMPLLPLDTLAYLTGVVGLLDDPAGAALASWWGIGASELARHSAAQARARIAGPGATDDQPTRLRALAWLVLAAAIG